MTRPRIRIRRAYEPPGHADGQRVLVDRLWPRGVTKAGLRLDAWAKEIAPSTRLRTWFGHDPARWREFRSRYHAELDANAGAAEALMARARRGRLTLVYAARDPDHNHALVLAAYLQARLAGRGPRAASAKTHLDRSSSPPARRRSTRRRGAARVGLSSG